MASNKETQELYAKDREAWRAWLEENHATAERVELVYYKAHSGKPSVTYDEAVEEAICFGWIDSRVHSMDDERFKQLYTPRRPGSIWARSNKDRVKRMIEAGLMTEAGRRVVDRAKADGSWTAVDDAENLIEPPELTGELDADPRARAGYEAYPDSLKKSIIYWITSAKREETRRKRVAQTVNAAIAGVHPVSGQ